MPGEAVASEAKGLQPRRHGEQRWDQPTEVVPAEEEVPEVWLARRRLWGAARENLCWQWRILAATAC